MYAAGAEEWREGSGDSASPGIALMAALAFPAVASLATVLESYWTALCRTISHGVFHLPSPGITFHPATVREVSRASCHVTANLPTFFHAFSLVPSPVASSPAELSLVAPSPVAPSPVAPFPVATFPVALSLVALSPAASSLVVPSLVVPSLGVPFHVVPFHVVPCLAVLFPVVLSVLSPENVRVLFH